MNCQKENAVIGFLSDSISIYNTSAPVVNLSNLNVYRKEIIQSNMKKSFSRMMQFYGLEINNECIEKSKDFISKSRNWLSFNNHNYKRMSRILKSLRIFGLNKEADMFFSFLKQLQKEQPLLIGISYFYWKESNMVIN